MRAYFTSFAISRAGAVAAVLQDRRLGRALPLTVRLVLLIGGSVVLGIGAGATLATGLGPGPFDVVVTGIARQTGLPFAAALWVSAAVMATIASVMGHRPGPGTVAALLVIGPVVQAVSTGLGARLPFTDVDRGTPVVALDRPAEVMLAVVVHLAGVIIIGFGAGAMITSGLGTGIGDLLAAATSSKLGRSLPLVRTGLELSWIGFGLMLGGVIGIGTVLVALTVGPSVRFGHGRVDAVVTGTFGRPRPPTSFHRPDTDGLARARREVMT